MRALPKATKKNFWDPYFRTLALCSIPLHTLRLPSPQKERKNKSDLPCRPGTKTGTAQGQPVDPWPLLIKIRPMAQWIHLVIFTFFEVDKN